MNSNPLKNVPVLAQGKSANSYGPVPASDCALVGWVLTGQSITVSLHMCSASTNQELVLCPSAKQADEFHAHDLL